MVLHGFPSSLFRFYFVNTDIIAQQIVAVNHKVNKKLYFSEKS